MLPKWSQNLDNNPPQLLIIEKQCEVMQKLVIDGADDNLTN